MLSRAQNTFHHNPRLRGPVSSIFIKFSREQMPWSGCAVRMIVYAIAFRMQQDQVFSRMEEISVP